VSSENPYQAPTTVPQMSDQWQGKQSKGYGGIGRLTYFLSSVGVVVVDTIVEITAEQNGWGEIVLAAAIIGLIANFALATSRLKNLGYRGLWVLGMFVPLLNIIVAVRCVAAPEGYADHKTLDTAGKIIVGIVIALIALLILAVSFA